MEIAQNSLEFFNPQEAKQFRESVEAMIEFVHAQKIPTVVAGGTSARPAIKLFMLLWRQKFPTEKPPNIFSLGRMPTRARDFSQEEAFKEKNEKKTEELAEEIAKNRKKLADILKVKPEVFVLEEFVHTGENIANICTALRLLGGKPKTGCLLSKSALEQAKKENWLPPHIRFDAYGAMEKAPSFLGKRKNPKIIRQGHSSKIHRDLYRIAGTTKKFARRRA
ncbi:MAG: hypothetical protein QXK06_02850 [Candidatus Diapherotrites archaeon]